jgi:beta-xylosidase
VVAWKKPDVGRSYPIVRPPTSDEFSSSTLGLQWQWNHNPVDDCWSLTDRPGFLRLKNIPAEKISLARNTLTQKLWDDAGVIDVKLDLTGMTDGQHAGFAFMAGDKFGPIGVTQTGGVRRIEWQDANGSFVTGAVVTGMNVWLRGTYEGADCHFAYSFDGIHFSDAPSGFKLAFKDWKGSRPAVYNFGMAGGYVDVDYFRYSYGATLKEAVAAVQN